MSDRTWFRTNLKAWRSDLREQLSREAARCKRIESHPDLPDMIRLCDITRSFIKRINDELDSVED